MKKEKFINYDIETLQNAVARSLCWSDVCKNVKVSVCTFNYKRIQKLCREYNISTDHFDTRQTFKRNKHIWTEDEVFVENSKIARTNLRKVLIRLNFYTGKCEECGIQDTWQGNPLIIEIDHINGNTTDNRKSNLRWLCPNCHSQTHTYRRSKQYVNKMPL